jgi:hypothetical protein
MKIVSIEDNTIRKLAPKNMARPEAMHRCVTPAILAMRQ